MKSWMLVLLLASGAQAGEFRLQSWKQPPNWKCQRVADGEMACKSKIPGQSQARMTMRLKSAAVSSLDGFKPKAGTVYFAEKRLIHGKNWMDSLHQTGEGSLVRSVNTFVKLDRKQMAFEVKVEAPEETYQEIESVVNRSIMSLRIAQ